MTYSIKKVRELSQIHFWEKHPFFFFFFFGVPSVSLPQFHFTGKRLEMNTFPRDNPHKHGGNF